MRRLRREDRAQSLIELALILPLLLLIVTGLFDLARAAWQENALAYAAREGTRYLIVHGSASSSPVAYCSGTCANSTVTSVVEGAATGVYDITVTIQFPDGSNDRNARVSVDATAPFVPLPSQYLLGGAFQITLRGGSTLVIQR